MLEYKIGHMFYWGFTFTWRITLYTYISNVQTDVLVKGAFIILQYYEWMTHCLISPDQVLYWLCMRLKMICQVWDFGKKWVHLKTLMAVLQLCVEL